MTSPTSSSDLIRRYAAVSSEIAAYCREIGREPDDVTLIVVTKFHPASLVQELYDAGVRDFGESRHQEARVKAAELDLPGARWHFVGQLQSKKARQVRAYADVLHSVDRPAVVTALALPDPDRSDPVDCFLQINLTDDPDRGGVQPAELAALADSVVATPTLRLRGVMAVAPLGGDPRSAFERTAEASQVVRAIEPTATGISAGMSSDWRDALDFGATHLRIGSAITGNRPSPG